MTRWTWVWVNSGSWWWTGKPGMMRFMGLQTVRHDWVSELNWTEPHYIHFQIYFQITWVWFLSPLRKFLVSTSANFVVGPVLNMTQAINSQFTGCMGRQCFPTWMFSSIKLNDYCCSVARLCLTLCDLMDCSTPDFPVLHYVPEFSKTHVHWIDDAIQPSHPLSSPSPPAFNLSSIRVFSNESALHIRWQKYWSFSISPSNEHSGLISFRINWFNLLAVQGTLKSLLQHHSSKASVQLPSAFFMVQLSHAYITTWKNHSFEYIDLETDTKHVALGLIL